MGESGLGPSFTWLIPLFFLLHFLGSQGYNSISFPTVWKHKYLPCYGHGYQKVLSSVQNYKQNSWWLSTGSEEQNPSETRKVNVTLSTTCLLSNQFLNIQKLGELGW